VFAAESRVRSCSFGDSMRISSGQLTTSCLGEELSRIDLDDWCDPQLEEDVVQSSNESQRTAPPEESAASRSVHIGEGAANSCSLFPCWE
jgi:hypothetical protein